MLSNTLLMLKVMSVSIATNSSLDMDQGTVEMEETLLKITYREFLKKQANYFSLYKCLGTSLIIITIYLHTLIFHSMLFCSIPMLTVYYSGILRNTIKYIFLFLS